MHIKKLGIPALLIGLIVVARILPHAPNFTPVAAVALISAMYLKGKNRWLIPLLGMFVSDLVIGFYSMPVMLSVYGSLLVMFGIGSFVRKEKNAIMSLTGVLSASLVFFFVTNFAVWYFGSMYPHTASGLMLSYSMAIPFFRSSLTGNLLYFGVLTGIIEYAYAYQRRKLPLASGDSSC